MQASGVTNKIAEISESARRSDWARIWGRLGFATGGVVYIVVAVMAFLVAYDGRGRLAGPEGAIQRIGAQPFGRVLLFIVATGLAGYSVWRIIEAITGRYESRDWKGTLTRIGVLFSGLAYGSFAVFATHRLMGHYVPADAGAQHWTARMLAHWWGPPLILLAGVILIGAGIIEMIFALLEKFREQLRIYEIPAQNRDFFIRLGKWGFFAQGMVITLAGMFLAVAGVKSDPKQAHSLDGTLRVLAHQPYGPWLLGVAAVGLAAYGLFMLVQARYRQM